MATTSTSSRHTSRHELVLSAVKEATSNSEPFVSLLKQNAAKSGQFKVSEYLQGLPRSGQARLTKALHGVCEWCVARLEEEAGELADVEEGVVLLLGGVVVFIRTYIQQHSPLITEPLIVTVGLLHEVILHLDFVPSLQNSLSHLLESWLHQQLPDWEQLIPNTILYLGARSLHESAKIADVKRMWLLKDTLYELDFQHESAVFLKRLLLTCYVNHNYLHSDEGQKFLSHLFSLNLLFMEDIHQTIKYQLPGSPMWLVEVYSKLYFRAWRLAKEPYLKKLEEHCLQDIMYRAVHARRQGQDALFPTLRKFLSCLHCETNQRGVQEMLHRLYRPFLWRSLKVANSHVRANAASLMLDVFPLYNPECNREEVDEVMQQQFDIMRELLFDQCEVVRVTVVIGVCRVLSCYWEMIPAHVIKSLLVSLVKDLAFDSSSASVRVAVLQGLCVVLQNRLSHPLMKDLLPLLRNHLHDVSERVRLALLDLLMMVKGMRAIKFGSICPLGHLLSRMDDSPRVVKRVCALLTDAFRPSQDSSEQLDRCIELLGLSRLAARQFYQYAASNVPLKDIARFIVVLVQTVSECVKTGGMTVRSEPKNGLSSPHTPDITEINQQQQENESDGGSIRDTQLLTGLLEVSVILWEGVRVRLDKPSHSKLKKRLTEEISGRLPLLFNSMKDDKSREALHLLASFLPKRSIPGIAQASLSSLSSSSTMSSHVSLLMGLVSWGMEEEVVMILHEGLQTGMTGESKIKKQSRTLSTSGPNGDMAVGILNAILFYSFILERMVKVESFFELADILLQSMTAIEQCFTTGSLSSFSSPQFLTSSLIAYIRIIMLRKAEDEDTDALESAVSDSLIWCERVVLPHLCHSPSSTTTVPKARNQRKRRCNQSLVPCDENVIHNLANGVVKSLLLVLADLLLLGLSSDALDESIGQFAAVLASYLDKVSSTPLSFLAPLTKLLYQLIESCRKPVVEGIKMSPACLSPVVPAADTLVEVTTKLASSQPDLFFKYWSTVKPFLSHAVFSSVQLSSLSLQTNDSLPIFTTLARSVLTSLNNHLKPNVFVSLPSCDTDLPLLVFNVCHLIVHSNEAQRLLLAHLDWLVREKDEEEKELCYLSIVHLSSTLTNVPALDKDINLLIRPVIKFLQSTEPSNTNREIFIQLKECISKLQQNM